MADKATRPFDRRRPVPTGNVLPNTRLSKTIVLPDADCHKSTKVGNQFRIGNSAVLGKLSPHEKPAYDFGDLVQNHLAKGWKGPECGCEKP